MAKIISKNLIMRTSVFGQGMGLTFRKKMDDFAMIFPFKTPRRIGVTMIFVFFPIDLLFLGADNKIIELKENLRPFRNYWPKTKKATTLIELPKNTILKNKLKIGQKIDWTSSNLLLLL